MVEPERIASLLVPNSDGHVADAGREEEDVTARHDLLTSRTENHNPQQRQSELKIFYILNPTTEYLVALVQYAAYIR